MMDSNFSLEDTFENAVSRTLGDSKQTESSSTILRYPGGKSRAVRTIREYFPKDVNKICSPFLGGGSIEISCAADGMKVYGSDAFNPLVNFWYHTLSHPVMLSDRVKIYHPLTRTKFYNLQKGYNNLEDNLEKAAVFFVLNRSSFSGTTLSGGMSPNHPRFNQTIIDKLRNFRSSNLNVECYDYKVALNEHKDMFLYLDPPYANGGMLYGNRGDMHKGFQHEELAEVLNKRDNWILSYNDCDFIRNLYSKHEIIEPEWSYGMSAKKGSKELLIVNV